MKRQRLVSVSGFEAAEMAATTAKKKKQPNQKAVAVLRKNTQEEEEEELKKKEGKKMEVMVARGGEENVSGLAYNWDDENWAWIEISWTSKCLGVLFGSLFGILISPATLSVLFTVTLFGTTIFGI